jgi:hypothetical protein
MPDSMPRICRTISDYRIVKKLGGGHAIERAGKGKAKKLVSQLQQAPCTKKLF